MSSPTLIFYITVFLVTHTAMMMCCSGNEVNATSGCVPRERNALLKLKASFSDPSSRLSSWNTSTDCCTWAGVGCDRLTGRHVVALHLQNERYEYNFSLYKYYYSQANMLSSEMIDSAILELKHLSYLDLTGNDFQESPIPSFLGLLNQLHHLNLSSANFRGVVPHHLGNLSKIEVLDLSDNSLVGELPSFLGDLTSLRDLDLSYNSYNSCSQVNLNGLTNLVQLDLRHNFIDCKADSISQVIGNNCHMESLRLTNNSFSGDISELFLLNLSRCPNHKLSKLALGLNKFYGQLPEQIGATFRSLKFLYLWGSNNISGPIPTSIGNLSALTVLFLSGNRLNGSIPPTIGNLRALESLVLSRNNLSGPIPASIVNLSALVTLVLSHNQISGGIPDTFGESCALQYLFLRNNSFTGEIPSSLRNCSGLRGLFVSKNHLSGDIPHFLGGAHSLQLLHLSNNKFTGELPSTLRNCTELLVLDVGGIGIYGELPKWIGSNLLGLRVLRLSNNDFYGTIPSDFCQLSSLQILDLSNNHLTGNVPRCFSNFTAMARFQTPWDAQASLEQVIKGRVMEFFIKTVPLVVTMDLSNNILTGEIPSGLTRLAALISFNLSHNHLQGHVPQRIGEMKSLLSLDLSNNKLIGEIPQSLSDLNFLSQLNLSRNNLSGQIPTGQQLQTLVDPSIYEGNPGLCGDLLPKKCHEDKASNSPNAKSHEAADEEGHADTIWFVGVVISGFASGFWGAIGVVMFKKSWRNVFFGYVDDKIVKLLGRR